MAMLKKMSIKYKILLVIILVAFITSSIGGILLTNSIITTYKKDLVGVIQSDALLIGEQMVTAIAFNDKKGGAQTLKKLETMQPIEHFLVFDNENQLFLSYSIKSEIVTPPTNFAEAKHWFTNDKLFIVEPIVYQNQKHGTLFVVASTNELTNKINSFLLQELLIFAVLAVLSLILAQVFQRIISQPILQLSNAAKLISEKHDYSTRLQSTALDEIGALYTNFNNMIEQIEIRENERDAALNDLKDSRLSFLKLSYSAFDGIVQLNAHGEIVFWNKAAKNIFGYTEDETTSRPVFMLFESAFNARLKNELATNKITTNDSDIANKRLEIKGIKNDGSEFPLAISIVPFQLKDSNNLVITLRDITEELRQKNELKAAKDKAEMSDRLKSAFLANMSHEIRTPMNSIIGFAELLQKPNVKENQRTKFLEYIQRSGRSLMNLINDIIDISKIEAGHLKIKAEPVNVNNLLDELYTSFKSITVVEDKPVSAELILTKGLKTGDVMVTTDPLRAKQIFSNLLSNALKFTDEGTVEFGYEVKNNEIKFFVKDTGIGIPKEKQEIIFEQFGQVEETYSRNKGGSGLGLAISKKLVELMGGQIWVDSTEGIGSVFYFTLPYENKPEFKVVINDDTIVEINNYNWKGKRILVAEDEEMNFMFIEEAVEQYGAEIQWAKNGKVALEKARNEHFDIILMDIKMPEMDGNTATKAIKAIKPDIPIIAQTAYAMQDEEQAVLEAGCDGYLTKPLKIDTLLATIDHYIKLK